MYYSCFDIDKIPDLTLSKYSFFDEGGVNGVLKKTNAFLRRMNREGLLSKVFYHLLYSYAPYDPAGQRLKAFFIVSGKDKDNLSYTQKMVTKSTLSAFYEFKPLESGDGSFGLKEIGLALNKNHSKNYSSVAALVKHVFSVQPSIVRPDNQDVKLFRLVEWKVNENARLYGMFQEMQAMNQPAAFRIDLFPVNYAARLRDALQMLRAGIGMNPNPGTPGIVFQRDENAEETLRQYEKIIKEHESTPHFRANILAFANDPRLAARLVDAAGAEALERGNYQIEPVVLSSISEKKHNVFDYMNKPIDVAGLDASGRIVFNPDPAVPMDTVSLNPLGRIAFLPSLFLLEEIRSFFAFPALHDGEAIEIPKETAPKFDDANNSIELGYENDDGGAPVFITTKSLKRHVFIAGVPGSGKTNTMLHLATTLWKTHKIPFLILEPAKKEYRALANIEGLEDLLIFSPSSGTMFPLHINPFEFPVGMRLSEHIRNLMAVFEGAFQLVGPAPFLVDSAIEAVYRDKGWHPHTENPNLNSSILPYPTLSEFYKKISIQVEMAGYEGETKSNVKSFVEVRLGSLLRREMGDLFDVPSSTIPPEEWLLRPALIELEAMGNGPANFLTLLLCTLIREALKVVPRDDEKYKEKPRHVIFLEEAHNLIGPEAEEATGENASPKLAATAYIVKMLAEVRALHEGIVIADQLPTKMAPEVIKNTVTKISHQLTAEDDRNLLGATMSASETQLEQMATYRVGYALITTEGLQRPYKAKINEWEKGSALGKMKYEPPSDNELFLKLADLLELEPPKNPVYDEQLKRSMEICYAKFFIEQDRLLDEMDKLIKAYKMEIPSMSILAEESGDIAAISRLSVEKKALNERLEKLLSDMAGLFHREKGYFEQNPIYKRKTVDLILSLRENWIHIYEYAKTWHRESAKKHKSDNDEILKGV